MKIRRLLWALWTLCAGILFVFENGGPAGAVLCTSVLVPLIWGLGAALWAKKTVIRLEVPEKAMAGESVTCRVTAERPSFSVFFTELDIKMRNGLTGEEYSFSLTVPPYFRGCEGAANIKCSFCGMTEITAENIVVSDPFGLTAFRCNCRPQAHICIMPGLYDTNVHVSQVQTDSSGDESYSDTRAGSDPGEIFGIREYVPGDPIKQIHWKLSQKTGKLMVRQLGLPVADSVLLLFETKRTAEGPSPEETDHSLRIFLSLSAALLKSDISHKAGWTDRGSTVLMSVTSPESFEAMEKTLLSAETGHWEESVSDFFIRQGDEVCSHTVIAGNSAVSENPMPGGRTTVLSQGGSSSWGVYTVNTQQGGCPEDIEI